MKKSELFLSRPFKTRNADEYDLEQVLNLFVNPIEGLTSPFDFENIIVKGRMGSGKTMYLRANHAYYLSGLVQSLLNDDQTTVEDKIKSIRLVQDFCFKSIEEMEATFSVRPSL